MQPFDVVATRLYNQSNYIQWLYLFCLKLYFLFSTNRIYYCILETDANGKGALYNGLYDALTKIFKTEGVFGLYKGVFPTWLRIAPHTVLCLVFYEKIARFYTELDK